MNEKNSVLRNYKKKEKKIFIDFWNILDTLKIQWC